MKRFSEKTQRVGDCIEWQAATNRMGYGMFRFEGENRLAHRVAWTLKHGDPGEMCVLHKCDNPKCVNTDHLFLGTRTDNHNDKMAKGRHVSKRTYDHAEIASYRAQGVMDQDIMAFLGCSRGTIGYAIKQQANQRA
jgi:hypothetical protein